MVNRNIAIILARGGSKRLPRKNLLEFGGKPLIAWTILAAKDSGLFEKILVSTDDDEITRIAINYGAEVPFRRQFAIDDFATASQATYAALIQAESYWGIKFHIVTQLMANCPLRSSQDIKNGITAFSKNSAPSQISCFQFGWMNPWWASTLDAKGSPSRLFPDKMIKRSQDLPPTYCPSGALWIANRDKFMESQNFYMTDHSFFPMDWISAMDIDDENDLKMANACLILRQASK